MAVPPENSIVRLFANFKDRRILKILYEKAVIVNVEMCICPSPGQLARITERSQRRELGRPIEIMSLFRE